MFGKKEREYASCGFMDFEALADFAEELSFDELLSVNGGCGGGCGGGGGGSYSSSYTPSRTSSGGSSTSSSSSGCGGRTTSSSGCGGSVTSSSSSLSSGCGSQTSTSSACGGSKGSSSGGSSATSSCGGASSSASCGGSNTKGSGDNTNSNSDKDKESTANNTYVDNTNEGNESESIMSETESNRAEVKNGWAWLLGTEIPDNPASFVSSDDYGQTEDRTELSKEHQVSTFHHGVDIPAPEGTRINAMLPGVVIDVTNSEQLGNSILIQLADNSVIRYSHCDKITVEVGATVLAGDQVATVGMTGTTTGPHVHVSYDGDGDGFYGEDYADNPNRILCPGY